MIRLAVRCTPELAERVLAELVEIVPGGVEEERGEGYVEYAIYGPPGEIPELPEIEAAAGDGLVEVETTEIPDDWADRWRDFHEPVLVGDWLVVRPSWETDAAPVGDGAIDVVIDPGRAFGTGAHATTTLSLELLGELAAADDRARQHRRPRHGIRRARDRRREARLRAGAWLSITSSPPSRRLPRTPSSTASVSRSSASTCARSPDRRRRTWLANLTAPLLRSVAGLMQPAGAGGPERLVVSGLLVREREDVEAAFAARGYAAADFRTGGEWGALLLRGV